MLAILAVSDAVFYSGFHAAFHAIFRKPKHFAHRPKSLFQAATFTTTAQYGTVSRFHGGFLPPCPPPPPCNGHVEKASSRRSVCVCVFVRERISVRPMCRRKFYGCKKRFFLPISAQGGNLDACLDTCGIWKWEKGLFRGKE